MGDVYKSALEAACVQIVMLLKSACELPEEPPKLTPNERALARELAHNFIATVRRAEFTVIPGKEVGGE